MLKRLFPFLLIGFVGCDVLGISKACTTDVKPGLLIDVRDSVSGGVVRGLYPVVATGGSIADTVNVHYAWLSPSADPDTLYLGPFPFAWEQPGRYAVDVAAPGYRRWRQEAIRVTEDECHVRTVRVTTRLQRQ